MCVCVCVCVRVCVRRIVLIIALTKSGFLKCLIFLMRKIIKTICYMDTKTVLVRVQKSVADGSIIF